MLMGTVSWVRSDVGVSSNTAPGRPAPVADLWQQKIGLTNEQMGKFHAAMDAHQKAMRPLQEQMRDQMQKLQDQVQKKAADKEILFSLNALKSIRKAMQDENEKYDDSLAGFLTPTQRATMAGGMMGLGMMHAGMGRPPSQGPGAGDKGMGQQGQPNPPSPAGIHQP